MPELVCSEVDKLLLGLKKKAIASRRNMLENYAGSALKLYNFIRIAQVVKLYSCYWNFEANQLFSYLRIFIIVPKWKKDTP